MLTVIVIKMTLCMVWVMCSKKPFSFFGRKDVGGFNLILPWAEILRHSSELLFISLYGWWEISVASLILGKIHTLVAFSYTLKPLTCLFLDYLFLVAYNYIAISYVSLLNFVFQLLGLFWWFFYACKAKGEGQCVFAFLVRVDSFCLPFLIS